MARRKLEAALLSLSILIAVAPGCGGSLARAQDALTVGDETTAEEQLRKALKSSSTQAEASRLLSVLLTQQAEDIAAKDPKGAEAKFTEAMKLDARNEEARLGLARLFMKRGFMDDARKLLEVADCHGCGRLMGMMLHDQGDRAIQTGEFVTAQAAYQEAWELGNDPADALGLVQCALMVQPADLDKAKAMLQASAELISRGQVELEQKFQEQRIQLLQASAAAGNTDLVEEVFRIRTASLQEEPEFDLRFKISQAQFRNGDSTPAIQRISSLLEKSGQYLEPTQREVMGAALVVMYGARAAQNLSAGDPVGAAKDIGAGLKLDPDNSRLKFQQILAIAANGRLPLAFKKLGEMRKGDDHDQVAAILWSMQAMAYIDEGKLAKAESALESAEGYVASNPELHLAQAMILAETRSDDLKKSELQEARDIAGFKYPSGRVNQVPGALAHLARAEALKVEQGVLHPWRGGGFDKRVTDLRAKLAFYPYAVQWYEGKKGGLVELVSKGGQQEVEFKGPRWLKGTAITSPDNSAEVQVPNVGIVYFEYGGATKGVLVERHAHIIVEL
ncbi:hypothetical protein PPSIR1_40600 [Plesiocystis pacifica SIR-1]|uniref:Tetratricopeptide repeat protein n=1 Tax=Plesiocystis pacifica SIR-1 TaxID=391625 RepID=A6FYQ0_9BACT|nr:tetratricopeptide repeat protein [Plesiocystis pacifica]EDM81322.1 hypothetical protein PPSIR1_40600 [Plesiocystis pacifica SIR-1]